MRSSQLDGSWSYAFAEAQPPSPVIGDPHPTSTTRFFVEDVKRVIAAEEGENDGASWVGVFELKDGRFAYVEAGCDYTGWD